MRALENSQARGMRGGGAEPRQTADVSESIEGRGTDRLYRGHLGICWGCKPKPVMDPRRRISSGQLEAAAIRELPAQSGALQKPAAGEKGRGPSSRILKDRTGRIAR